MDIGKTHPCHDFYSPTWASPHTHSQKSARLLDFYLNQPAEPINALANSLASVLDYAIFARLLLCLFWILLSRHLRWPWHSALARYMLDRNKVESCAHWRH